MEIKGRDLINFSNLSKVLAKRRDVIRDNRIPKKYQEVIKELENYLNYWLTLNRKKV